MPIFIRTRIYPSPPAPDNIVNVNAVSSVNVGSILTATAGMGGSFANNVSTMTPMSSTRTGITGPWVAATLKDDGPVFSAPEGGIELSGWT